MTAPIVLNPLEMVTDQIMQKLVTDLGNGGFAMRTIVSGIVLEIPGEIEVSNDTGNPLPCYLVTDAGSLLTTTQEDAGRKSLDVNLKSVDSTGVCDPDTGAGRVSATATIAADVAKAWKVHIFTGSCKDQNYKIELKINGIVKWSDTFSAGTEGGLNMGEKGFAGIVNQAISVVVTPDASGRCSANLAYYQK